MTTSNEKSSALPPTSHATSSTHFDLPPAYDNTSSIPSIAVTPSPPSVNPVDALSRLSGIDFSKYNIAPSKISDDRTVTTTTQVELTSKRYALAKFVHEQAALPPKPLMCIRGTHTNNHNHRDEVTDFDLQLNLTSLLNLDLEPGMGRATDGEATSTRSRLRVLTVDTGTSPGEGPLKQRSSRDNENLNPLDVWIKRFCEDKAENKSFALTRQIDSLPIDVLEGLARTLVASTRYRGKLSVTFPVIHRQVVVHKPAGNWFASMLRLYARKKYESVEAVWEVDSSELVAQRWWAEWQNAVRNAVLSGRRGWVTVEDWMEARMGLREKEKGRDWGVDGQ